MNWRARLFTHIFVAVVVCVFAIALWTAARSNQLINQMYAAISFGGILFLALVHVSTVLLAINREREVIASLLKIYDNADDDRYVTLQALETLLSLGVPRESIDPVPAALSRAKRRKNKKGSFPS